MMKKDTVDWAKRLEKIKLKELYLLFEMSKLNQSIGMEEVLPSFPDPQPLPGSYHAINRRFSEKRQQLSKFIWKDIKKTYLRTRNEEASDLWAVNVKAEGYLNFLVLWDHWQYDLKSVACTRGSRIQNPEVKSQKESFWEDSSDEEYGI